MAGYSVALMTAALTSLDEDLEHLWMERSELVEVHQGVKEALKTLKELDEM